MAAAARRCCRVSLCKLLSAPTCCRLPRLTPVFPPPFAQAEYEAGGEAPLICPFAISEDEAAQRFQAWQHGRARLGPGGLLPAGGPWGMRPALLPFWLWRVTAAVEYSGSVEVPSGDGSGGGSAWRDSGWRELPAREFGWEAEPALRVYGALSLGLAA